MKRARLFHRNSLSLAIALGATGVCYSTAGAAMQFHRHGAQLIATGGTEASDPETLRNWLDRAAAAGRPITTVVFRNGPGGAASGGVGMGRIIRDEGLNTILDGGCFSACADAFTAGIQRGMTMFDLPVYERYDRTTLGVHGEAENGVPTPYPGQEKYLDYYREMLGPEGAHAMPRITQAHYELIDSNGFLRYYDPALEPQQPARFCPGADETSSGGCTDHAREVTIRSDALVNRAGYAVTGDILDVSTRIAGNVNPHYGNDSLDDAWGIIRLRSGSQWSLDEASSADAIWVNGGSLQLGRDGNLGSSQALVADREGVIALRGATLDTQARISDGATLGGYGTVTSPMRFEPGGLFVPRGITLRPYALTIDEAGSILPLAKQAWAILDRGSAALFDVSARDHRAGLTLEQREVAAVIPGEGLLARHSRSALLISPAATLALNIRPGYYAAGGERPLVETVIDRTPLAGFAGELCSDPEIACMLDPVEPASHPFVLGSFQQALNQDEADKIVDLTEPGAVVHARKNSLLSFTVQQSADKIALIANPAFDDTSIFASRRSGDGLGTALRTASYRSATPLAPLLGALQFADRDIVRAQSGALRGDAYATARSADVNLVREFGGVVDQHLQHLRRGQDEQSAAFAGSLLSANPAANRNTIAGNMNHMLRRLAGAPAESPAAGSADGVRFWGRGFGTTGRVDARQGSAGMRQNSSGLLLGMERSFAGGKIVLGGSLGFGSMSAKAGDRQFRADVGAVDASAYIDARHGAGYVSGAVRYTRLDHDAIRSIEGIAGLGGAHKASYRNHAWSARFEHGLQWTGNKGTVWQPLLPVLDYVKLAGQRFVETGGPAALRGRGGSHESLRGGVGLRVWRSFQTRRSGVLTPHAQILFTHEFKHRDGRLQASFAQDPTLPFKVIGPDTGRNTVAWNLGVGSQLNPRSSIALDYVGEHSSGRAQHGIMLGLAHRF